MAHDAPWEHYHDDRHLAGLDDVVAWTTIGFDVGSATTQIVFSRVALRREDAHYVVSERSVLHESEIILTPYAEGETIDERALASFVEREFAAAGVERGQIDTGAIILTGFALSKANARAVASAIADEGGRMVAVAAGDLMEARLAASAVGAKARSAELKGALAHIDVGGGTTKLSHWRAGACIGLAAVDIGARIVTYDADRRIERIEAPGQRILEGLDIRLAVGERIAPELEARIAGAMARDALRYAGALREPPRGPPLLRTEPLPLQEAPDAVMFSGGVSEYVYGRETRTFGDLGAALGHALREETERAGVEIIPFDRGIRATVLGVSQHTAQLTSATVFASETARLPLRNVPMLAPNLDLSGEALDGGALRRALGEALRVHAGRGAVAQLGLALPWQGSATHARLSALSEAIAACIAPHLAPNAPLVVVVESDIAGVLGAVLEQAIRSSHPVLALDGIHVHDFDHLDIGAPLANAAALPVVVKSLLFSGPSRKDGARKDGADDRHRS